MTRASSATTACLALALFALFGCSTNGHEDDRYPDYHPGVYSDRGVYYDDPPEEHVSCARQWLRDHYFDDAYQPWGQPDRPSGWGSGYHDWEHPR